MNHQPTDGLARMHELDERNGIDPSPKALSKVVDLRPTTPPRPKLPPLELGNVDWAAEILDENRREVRP